MISIDKEIANVLAESLRLYREKMENGQAQGASKSREYAASASGDLEGGSVSVYGVRSSGMDSDGDSDDTGISDAEIVSLRRENAHLCELLESSQSKERLWRESFQAISAKLSEWNKQFKEGHSNGIEYYFDIAFDSFVQKVRAFDASKGEPWKP